MRTPYRPSALLLPVPLAAVLLASAATGAVAAGPSPHAPLRPSKAGPATPAPAPPPAARPAGPLDTPSQPVAHPDRQLVETLALAGRRLVGSGVDGLLILSDDNGVTWRQVTMPVSVTLTDLRFTDERTGWAIGHGGAVLRTDDAGEHWTLLYDGARAARTTLQAARLANAADNVRDRQVQAAEALVRDDPDRPFLLIQAQGLDTVRLLGAGGLAVESLDGGRHWLPWSNGIDNPERLPLDGLAERDGYVLAAGGHGILLGGVPADGLHALKSPYEGSFFGVVDAGRYGFVPFGQQGHAYASTDPGPDLAGREVVWHRIADPSPTALTAGLLRQDGSVLLGDAAGATWQLAGRPDFPRLDPARAEAPFPILAMAEAADRSVILAGPGGVLRFGPEPPAPSAMPPVLPVATSPVAPPVIQSAATSPPATKSLMAQRRVAPPSPKPPPAATPSPATSPP